MRMKMSEKKKKLGKAIRAVLFLLLAGLLFIRCTYLFRNVHKVGRQNLLSFYEEDKNSLDMVMIGSSRVYRLWNPMLAWGKSGLVSHNYSVALMHPANYLSAIQDVYRTQKPKLIVIEASAFTRKLYIKGIGAGARRFLDTLDFDLFRVKAVRHYAKMNELSFEDAMTLYIDLMQYHENYYALWNRKHWRMSNNRVGSLRLSTFFKGYGLVAKISPQKPIDEYLTDECSQMYEKSEQCYREVLTYCRDHGIEVLTVVAPPAGSKDEIMQYNTMEKISAEYGFRFVDLNKQLSTVGIDYDRDFYNSRHMNYTGSKKLTAYLLAYLKAHYELPDHREDDEYNSWDQEYKLYKQMAHLCYEKEMENAKITPTYAQLQEMKEKGIDPESPEGSEEEGGEGEEGAEGEDEGDEL